MAINYLNCLDGCFEWLEHLIVAKLEPNLTLTIAVNDRFLRLLISCSHCQEPCHLMRIPIVDVVTHRVANLNLFRLREH